MRELYGLLIAIGAVTIGIPIVVAIILALMRTVLIVVDSSNVVLKSAKLIAVTVGLPGAFVIILAITFDWSEAYDQTIGQWVEGWRKVAAQIKFDAELRRHKKQESNH